MNRRSNVSPREAPNEGADQISLSLVGAVVSRLFGFGFGIFFSFGFPRKDDWECRHLVTFRY